MMLTEYRLEIEALNAIVSEHKRTNELLEKLLAVSAQTGVQKPTERVQIDVKQQTSNKTQARGKRT